MMVKDNSQPIQAFPIQANTFVGTASSEDVTNKSIVHTNADTTLTFSFPSGDISIAALVGSDFAIGNGCLTLTSTAEVMIS